MMMADQLPAEIVDEIMKAFSDVLQHAGIVYRQPSTNDDEEPDQQQHREDLHRHPVGERPRGIVRVDPQRVQQMAGAHPKVVVEQLRDRKFSG
jgi:hypothetical protein